MLGSPTRRLVLGLVCSLSLGCAAGTQLAYENADWLIMREAKAAFCPTAERKAVLEKDIQKILWWHRKGELPRYVRALEALALAVETATGEAAAFKKIGAEAMSAWKRGVKKMMGPASRHLTTIEDSEKACFAKHIEGKQEAHDKTFAKPMKQYIHDRMEDRIEWFERFVGDLNDAQVKKFHIISPVDMPGDKASAQARLRADRRFLASIQTGKIKADLKSWEKDPYFFYDALDKKAALARRGGFTRTLKKISDLLTEDQRKAFVKNLRTFAKEFRVLSGRGK